MRFNLDNEIVELRTDEVQSLIGRFMEFFDEEMVNVWVFGGLVREPDKVHGDIDLLIEVPVLPEYEDVEDLAFDWEDALVACPELSLIDCFFTDGYRVVSFRYNLQYLQEYDITTVPKTGGLDDDDTDIYIGEKVEPGNL